MILNFELPIEPSIKFQGKEYTHAIVFPNVTSEHHEKLTKIAFPEGKVHSFTYRVVSAPSWTVLNAKEPDGHMFRTMELYGVTLFRDCAFANAAYRVDPSLRAYSCYIVVDERKGVSPYSWYFNQFTARVLSTIDSPNKEFLSKQVNSFDSYEDSRCGTHPIQISGDIDTCLYLKNDLKLEPYKTAIQNAIQFVTKQIETVMGEGSVNCVLDNVFYLKRAQTAEEKAEVKQRCLQAHPGWFRAGRYF